MLTPGFRKPRPIHGCKWNLARHVAVITRVLTQGRGEYPQWVALFTLPYRYDVINFISYLRNGVEKVTELLQPIAGCRNYTVDIVVSKVCINVLHSLLELLIKSIL
jgi:hypothetical protein